MYNTGDNLILNKLNKIGTLPKFSNSKNTIFEGLMKKTMLNKLPRYISQQQTKQNKQELNTLDKERRAKYSFHNSSPCRLLVADITRLKTKKLS